MLIITRDKLAKKPLPTSLIAYGDISGGGASVGIPKKEKDGYMIDISEQSEE